MSYKNSWNNIAHMAYEDLRVRKIMYRELQQQLRSTQEQLKATEEKYRRRTKQFFCS